MRLQGIGQVASRRASEVKIGDVLMWNFGFTSKVIDLRKTAKSVIFTTENEKGQVFTRKRAADSEVCVKDCLA
jgi:hypothetical protein